LEQKQTNNIMNENQIDGGENEITSQTPEDESRREEKTEVNTGEKKWIWWILLSFLGLLVVLAVAVYFFNWRNRYSDYFLKVIPYPAVMIGNANVITFSDVDKNLASIRSFYENQDFSQVGLRVDFNSSDGAKRLKIKERNLLSKMIEDRLIEVMAKKKGINVTQKELDQLLQSQIDQGADKDQISKELKLLYGWSMNDFKERMIKPDLYRERLTEYIKNNDSAVKEQKNLSLEASEKLKKGGIFSEVAKEYSYGENAANGGELGWFKTDDLMQPIAERISKMEKGDTSDVIETDLGFHIIRLDDKKIEDGTQIYQVSQIFIPTLTIGDWLAKNARDIHVRMLVRGFRWNDQSRTVEFTDQRMIDFENNLDSNSSGDASLLLNS
jgi:parvulin-like peptidyl-prolyl isomerase